jgi:hypothetical protein
MSMVLAGPCRSSNISTSRPMSAASSIGSPLGGNNVELQAHVALARKSAIEESSPGSIERAAWELWSHRSRGPSARTAVAQLLFALRAHRLRQENYRRSCATPVLLLEQLAAHRGELLEPVFANFTEYVSGQHMT